MSQVNRFPPAIVVGKGTKANILKTATYAQNQGEIAMATDEKRFFVGDSTYRFEDLCNFIFPYAVVDVNGNIVTHNGEIVFTM